MGNPPISQAQLPPLPETSPCKGGPRAPPGQAPTPSTHPGATWALTRGPRSPGCQPPMSASAVSRWSPGYTRLRSRPGEGVAESPALSTGLQTPGQMVQPSPPPRGLTGAGSREDSGVTAGHHPEPRPGSRGRALAALSAAPPSWAQPWASHPAPLSSGPWAREMQPLRKPHGPGTPEMGWKGITTLKSMKGWLA